MGLKENKTLVFFKKSSSRIFILAGIILIIALYHDHYYSKRFFNFPSEGTVVKNIKEHGVLLFTSGNKLELKNEYLSKEFIKKNGSILEIEGGTGGEFDPNMKPLMKSDHYAVFINYAEVIQSCSENFVMQYPSFLRRFIYYMPSSPLFDQQKWEIVSCGGKFICDYTLSLYDSKRDVEMICSGEITGINVAITGEMKINRSFNGFSEVTLEISSESPELISTWTFSESSRTK